MPEILPSRNQINIYVTKAGVIESFIQRLNQLGIREDRSVNYLVVEAILQYLGREETEMDEWICTVCGYVYDPKEGDPRSGTPVGTSFADLSEDWTCRDCSARKNMFEKI